MFKRHGVKVKKEGRKILVKQEDAKDKITREEKLPTYPVSRNCFVLRTAMKEIVGFHQTTCFSNLSVSKYLYNFSIFWENILKYVRCKLNMFGFCYYNLFLTILSEPCKLHCFVMTRLGLLNASLLEDRLIDKTLSF